VSTTYSLAQEGAEQAERERLALLEQVCDPLTTRLLDEVGVKDGWRCLDVGAGAGSVSKIIAERVGPKGSVLAIDLDTRLLEGLAGDVIEVRCHDLLADPVGTDFDLVHSRHVLMHLSSRLAALTCMVNALRPGGVLAIGDVSMGDVHIPTGNPAWERAWSATLDVMVSVGWDPMYGHRLAGDLEALGLADVSAEETHSYQRGGSPMARLLADSMVRLRERMHVSPSDFDEAQRVLRDPSIGLSMPTLVMASGRKP
jgi:SAM-dependent methyltransferase